MIECPFVRLGSMGWGQASCLTLGVISRGVLACWAPPFPDTAGGDRTTRITGPQPGDSVAVPPTRHLLPPSVCVFPRLCRFAGSLLPMPPPRDGNRGSSAEIGVSVLCQTALQKINTPLVNSAPLTS